MSKSKSMGEGKPVVIPMLDERMKCMSRRGMCHVSVRKSSFLRTEIVGRLCTGAARRRDMKEVRDNIRYASCEVEDVRLECCASCDMAEEERIIKCLGLK